MALALRCHVVGDLTVGKPELVEFHDTETLKSAIQAIADSPEGSIPVWRKPSSSSSHGNAIEDTEMRQQRFVGILSSLDIAAFLANTRTHNHQSMDMDKKLTNTAVSNVIVPNKSLLRIVDPSTRLIDALDMMKQGVKCLLVPKSLVVTGKGISKRLLKNIETSSDATNNNIVHTNKNVPSCSSSSSSSSITASIPDKFCCLSREDVLRFIICCLGALAPLPQTSMVALGAINSQYSSIESSTPAIEAAQRIPQDPSAVAVVESKPEGKHKIIGEISACKLWKCDYLATAWALASLSAAQFVMGVEENDASGSNSRSLVPDLSMNSSAHGDNTDLVNGVGSRRPKKFSSRSIGFFSNHAGPCFGCSRSRYRGRSAPLTCKVTSSLAAVMAQMLSHRATHVWVTEDESDDVIVGVVGYVDILNAVTKPPTAFLPANRFTEGLGNEIQS